MKFPPIIGEIIIVGFASYVLINLFKSMGNPTEIGIFVCCAIGLIFLAKREMTH